jgi:hypothetical protein
MCARANYGIAPADRDAEKLPAPTNSPDPARSLSPITDHKRSTWKEACTAQDLRA